MITFEEAKLLAQKEVARLASESGDEFIVSFDKTIERNFGWLFFYQSRAFVETGENKYRLAGNGPIVIEKSNGKLTSYGSTPTVNDIISEFEKGE